MLLIRDVANQKCSLIHIDATLVSVGTAGGGDGRSLTFASYFFRRSNSYFVRFSPAL